MALPLQYLRSGVAYEAILLKEIVTDHLFRPPQIDGVKEIRHQLHPCGSASVGIGRSRVKFDPFVRGEVGLHPAVGVILTDGPGFAQRVIFAGTEAVDQARGNSQLPEHDRHCRSKVFAVPLSDVEKEHCERIRTVRSTFQFEAVAVVGLEILFQGEGLSVGMRNGLGHFPCKIRDPGIEILYLKIHFPDGFGWCGQGDRYARRIRLGDV